MPDGYEHDVFVSYRRIGNQREWVQNHLAPRLDEALADHLPRKPRVFVDQEIEAGEPWRDRLKRALQRSILMVAVLSPPYFTSEWCMAEWRTILRRQELLGFNGIVERVLVYPVRYSDGDRFPAEARGLQQEVSFANLRYPYQHFAESPKYLDFHDAVERVAELLVHRLENPPPWQPDWPVVVPGPPEPPPPAGLPRL